MKKCVLLSSLLLSFIALVPNSQALEIDYGKGKCRDVDSVCNFVQSKSELDRAIQLRNRNYLYDHQINNLTHKNRLNQQERHNIGKKLIRVSERSTQLSREGELQDVPYYRARRSVSIGNMQVANTAKQNWRRAAINYYVDGENGYTNPEGMREGVKYGSTHKVDRIKTSHLTRGAISKSSLRLEQKLMAAIDDNSLNKIDTGKQRTSTRYGTAANRFFSPVQSRNVYDEYPNYLRTLRSIMDGMQNAKVKENALENSTEAE